MNKSSLGAILSLLLATNNSHAWSLGKNAARIEPMSRRGAIAQSVATTASFLIGASPAAYADDIGVLPEVEVVVSGDAKSVSFLFANRLCATRFFSIQIILPHDLNPAQKKLRG